MLPIPIWIATISIKPDSIIAIITKGFIAVERLKLWSAFAPRI